MERMFAFIVPCLALLIPIVAILTTHQRRMAELIHGSNQNQRPQADVDSLRMEVQELKQIIHQQTIAIDGLQSRPLPTGNVSDRLTEVP